MKAVTEPCSDVHAARERGVHHPCADTDVYVIPEHTGRDMGALADVAALSGYDAVIERRARADHRARAQQGWALRIVPNQLYYAFFIPVIWLRFFSPRYASTSESTQHSR